jgi:hypothetical protein
MTADLKMSPDRVVDRARTIAARKIHENKGRDRSYGTFAFDLLGLKPQL